MSPPPGSLQAADGTLRSSRWRLRASHFFGLLINQFGREPEALILLVLVGFVRVATMMAVRPLWFDELHTFYLSQMRLGAIWPALRQGADLNPPLMYWLTRASFAVFGTNAFAARIPSMSGFLVMAVCLGWFVRRRSTVHYGIAAMTLPLLTDGFTYAAEARPYGLLLGFSGIALLAWQAAAEGKRRRLAL